MRGWSGERLADAEGPAANIYVDFDGALAVVHEVVFRAPRMASVGGLADAIRPYLSAELDETLRKPIFDAVDGAILLVGGALPKLARR